MNISSRKFQVKVCVCVCVCMYACMQGGITIDVLEMRSARRTLMPMDADRSWFDYRGDYDKEIEEVPAIVEEAMSVRN